MNAPPRVSAETSALLLVASTITTLHPEKGFSSTTVDVPRFALFDPGASSSTSLLLLTVTPALAVTVTVPVVTSAVPEWAAASTFTASVSMPAKSPLKASVSVAEASPLPLMDSPGMAGAATKREARRVDAAGEGDAALGLVSVIVAAVAALEPPRLLILLGWYSLSVAVGGGGERRGFVSGVGIVRGVARRTGQSAIASVASPR